MGVTFVDGMMLVILGVCFVLGFWNGLIKQIASILGIIAGVVVAARLAPGFAGVLHGRVFEAENTSRVAAYVILFLGVALAVWLVGLLIRSLARKAELGFTDRLWGAGFGAVKGVVFCWALLLAIAPLADDTSLKQSLNESILAPRLLWALNKVRAAFPEELDRDVNTSLGRWQSFREEKQREQQLIQPFEQGPP
jgi:membrane protein required for colicin V production